jgi:hypothetical protein
MAEMNQIRQKVQQARELARQGKYAQAKALLKGLTHPKALELVSKLDERLAQQPKPTGKFPLLPVLGVVGMVVVILIGGLFILNASRAVPELPPTLELLITPTSDCTDQTVRDWWQTQIQTGRDLNTFAANASAATMTLPGERLTAQIAKLRELQILEPLPACASAELQAAVADLFTARDSWLSALEEFNSGTLSMNDAVFRFTETDKTWQDAQVRVAGELP